MSRARVSIGSVGDDPILSYATSELARYLRDLFSVDGHVAKGVPSSGPAFLLGVRDDLVSTYPRLPETGPEGIILQSIDRNGPLQIVSGGTPVAVLWGVYRLAEEWGVQYLPHGDVLPEKRQFRMPRLDITEQPILKHRHWRVVNDFAWGPESWGMDDYTTVLDQLAKMRFNSILISTWSYQPFLRPVCGGIRKETGTLWFGEKFPITDDMAGRELFDDRGEFWNPDLPLGGSQDELFAASEHLLHEIIRHAHSRGIESVLTLGGFDFPPEFAPLLPDHEVVRQLGQTGIVPGRNMPYDHESVTALVTSVIHAAVNTYPEVDRIAVSTPEFRQWTGQYRRAWDELDAKYDLGGETVLADIIAKSRQRASRVDYMKNDPERATDELLGDIVLLRMYDRIFRDLDVLADTAHPDVGLVYSSVSEELLPILPRILKPDTEVIGFIDYTPTRVLKRRESLQLTSTDEQRTLILTLHDDNVGVIPQLAGDSFEELVQEMRLSGWSGFQTRYWLIGDHDPTIAYLSHAAWDADTDREAVYRGLAEATFGNGAKRFLRALHGLERATRILEEHGLGFSFTTPSMIIQHWNPGSSRDWLIEVRALYSEALTDIEVAAANDGGSPDFKRYWIARMRFGLRYVDVVFAMRESATHEDSGDHVACVESGMRAVRLLEQSIRHMADAVQDNADRGLVAVLNEYCLRPLKAKVDSIGKGA
jgi:hypothetical protein